MSTHNEQWKTCSAQIPLLYSLFLMKRQNMEDRRAEKGDTACLYEHTIHRKPFLKPFLKKDHEPIKHGR